MKRKIVILNSLYSPDIVGGAEISSQILAESLSSMYEVEIVTTGSSKTGSVDIVNGIKVNRLPINNLYWVGDLTNKSTIKKMAWHFINSFNIRQYFILKEYFKINKPTIIHTQNLPGLSIGAWKAAKELNIPIVHTLRDYTLITPTNLSFFNVCYRYFVKQISSHVNGVIGISEFILNKHTTQNIFKNASKIIISNVVENTEGDSILQKKVSSLPLKLGYFGRLTLDKGIKNLVFAIKNLDKSIVEELIICGDGPMLQELQNVSKNDNRIKIMGKISKQEVKEKMMNVDLTVVPSLWEEPFGRVIIESYERGTPVIASNRGGMPEVLLSPEKFSFNPTNIEEIKKLIIDYKRLPVSDKKKLIQDCINYSKEFNTKMLVKKHREFYDSILLENSK